MPIKNYSTTINPAKTVGHIQTLLVDHGARRVMIEYNTDRQPESIAFDIEFQPGRFMPFILRANELGCLDAMKRDELPRRFLTVDHARCVAWRLVLLGRCTTGFC